MNRRRLLQIAVAGLMAVATPKIVDNGLELIASVSAEEKKPVSEAEFERLMKYDTVDDVLAEYSIGSVDDSSYQKKVYDSDKHVMVLFYNNRSEGSKGLAVLIGVLSEEFGSQFEIYGYTIGNGSTTPLNKETYAQNNYGIKDTPSILLYHEDDTSKYKDRINGRITSQNNLMRMFTSLFNHIKKNYY